MAASTITRATWTNDSGTPTVPVGDGTVLNNTRLQNDIYAKIDEMFAGAGTYATLTLGGKFAAEGFGSHTFTAGGVGANLVRIRNTTAGAGNFAAVQVQADSAATDAGFGYFSTTYTSAADIVADGARLYSGGAGGLSLSASNASGAIRFYSGGTSERARLTTAGMLLVGDTTDVDVTVGLVLNQGPADDQIIAMKSSDVAHGLATAETDTYGSFRKANNLLGGLRLESYAAALSTTANGFQIFSEAASGSGDTTKGAGANGYFDLRAFENGAGITANENIIVFRNGNAVTHILDADGDSHQDVGTAWTNFDDFDDHELLTALSAGVSRPGDPLRDAFGGLLEKHRRTLEDQRIVTFNEDGHHFVNWSRLNMLHVGATRQNAERIASMERRLRALEA